MLAVSCISTMNVDWPRAMLSDAPTRAKMRSTSGSFASRAGTNDPACAIRQSSAVCRRYVDLPPMFGPGQDHQLASWSRSASMSFGTNELAGVPLDDRVAPVDDRHLVAVVHVRLGVVADRCRVGQRGQHVEARQRARGAAGARRHRPPRARAAPRRARSSRSRMRSSAPRTFSSYSLSAGVMKRSPPAMVCLRMVVGRDVVEVRLRDLDVVAEDAVEADLERRDAGARPLALLHLGDDLLAGSADVPQLVELRVHAVANHAAVARQGAAARPAARARARRAAPAGRRAPPSGSGSAAPAARRAAAARAGRRRARPSSATRSRGPATPSAARATSRSRSWTAFSASRNFARSMLRKASSSTASRRSRMGSSATSGRRSHDRRSRPPIGVTVASSSSSSDPARPPSRAFDDLEVLERGRDR